MRYRDTGDPRALGRLFDVCAPELLRVARHLAPDAAEAEDLVQATFLALLEHPERYDGKRPARAWMVGILTLEARQARRRAARRADGGWFAAEQEQREAALDASLGAAGDEQAAFVHAALARMPELYRGVLERHLAGDAPAAIAEALERAPGTVRVQLHRGLELLRRALPAGLAGGIGLAVPGGVGARGLAALRAEVLALAQAAGPPATALATTATTATTLGALLMTTKLGMLGLVLAATALWIWNREPAPNSVSAGGDGVVRLIDAGEATVILAAAGETEVAASARRPVATESTPSDALRLDRLQVSVRFADGEPVPGAIVRSIPFAPGAPLRTAAADERGEILLTGLEPGQYGIYGDRGGHGIAQVPRITIDAPPADPGELDALLAKLTPHHTLTLPPGRDVAGRVVDGLGRAVAGAELWISTGMTRSSGTGIGLSAADGSFLLRQLGEECFFGARAAGHAPTEVLFVGHLVDTVRRERGEVPSPLEVLLTLPGPGARIEGRLLDPAGRPVAGARVRLGAQDFFDSYGPGGAAAPPPPIEVRTDAQGRFAGDGLAPGRVEAACLADGFAAATGAVQVGPDDVGWIELALEDPVWVLGRATDRSGAPLDLVSVSVHRHRVVGQDVASSFDESRALTDAEGRFRLGPLSSGRLALSAYDADRSSHARHTLDARSGRTYEWSFALDDAPMIAGRAVDAAGQGLPGWTVVAKPLVHLGPPPRAAFTDAAGRFELSFPAGGAVRLELLPPDENLRAGRRAAPRAPVAWIEPVEVGARDVLLAVDPAQEPTARILGTLGAAVHPAPERALFLLRHREFGRILEAEQPLQPGAFELAELPAGVFWLTIEAPGCAPLERGGIELVQGQSLDLGPLELVAAAGITLHLADAYGATIAPHVTLEDAHDRHRWGTLVGRTWRSGSLAPGAYRVLVQHEDRADIWLEFELRAGETFERELTLQPGIPLALVFLEERETPALGPIELRILDASGGLILRETLQGEPDRPASRHFRAPLEVLTIEATDPKGRSVRETLDLRGRRTDELLHVLQLR